MTERTQGNHCFVKALMGELELTTFKQQHGNQILNILACLSLRGGL
jgi:hypothetical protein